MDHTQNQTLYANENPLPSAMAVEYGTQGFGSVLPKPSENWAKATSMMSFLAFSQGKRSVGGQCPSLGASPMHPDPIRLVLPQSLNVPNTPTSHVLRNVWTTQSDNVANGNTIANPRWDEKAFESNDQYSRLCREPLSLLQIPECFNNQLDPPPQSDPGGYGSPYNASQTADMPQRPVRYGEPLQTPGYNDTFLADPTSFRDMPTHNFPGALSERPDNGLGPLPDAQRLTPQYQADTHQHIVPLALDQVQQGYAGGPIFGHLPMSQESIPEAGYLDNSEALTSPSGNYDPDDWFDHRAPFFQGLVPSNERPGGGKPIHYRGDGNQHITSHSLNIGERLSPYWSPQSATDSAMATRRGPMTVQRIPSEPIRDLDLPKSASYQQSIAPKSHDPSAIQTGKRKRDLVPDPTESQARERRDTGRRHKRPFTDREKMIIKWKRDYKTVCDECRKAKRKCDHAISPLASSSGSQSTTGGSPTPITPSPSRPEG